MVLSLSYLLTELNSKVKCHTAQLEEIDFKADDLSKQAVSVEGKLEEDINLFIEELVKRKEVLKEQLWQIVRLEDKQLALKRAGLVEHIKVLKGLVNMAFHDSVQFRELYGNAVEKYGKFDVGSDDVVDLRLSADNRGMMKNIKEFGTISCDVYERGCCEILPYENSNDNSVSSQGDCSYDDFDVAGREQAGHENSGERVLYDSSSCQLADCCNCIDVCEDTGMKIAKRPDGSKKITSTLEEWLWHPKEPSCDGGSDLVLDNKIASQLESLHLSQAEQAVGFQHQQALSSELNDNWQNWLASKQRELTCNGHKGSETSAVGQVWDEIKARTLHSWLKPEMKQEFSDEEKDSVHENTTQFDSIKSSERSLWLKDSWSSKESMDSGLGVWFKVNAEETARKRLSHCKAVRPTELSQWLKAPYSTNAQGNGEDSSLKKDIVHKTTVDYGIWLKRKIGESDVELESETTKLYKRIRSTPLEKWLKTPKPQQIEEDSFGSRSVSVNKADDITCVPLEMWLKQMSISSDKMEDKYDEWLICQPPFQKKSQVNSPKSKVLQQFDEIANSSLNGWLKKMKQAQKPACRDLCKWLKNGPQGGCRSCFMASSCNPDLWL